MAGEGEGLTAEQEIALLSACFKEGEEKTLRRRRGKS
jgi:hypothetical protein